MVNCILTEMSHIFQTSIAKMFSIYIPRVTSKTNKQTIIDAFEKYYGKVSHVDVNKKIDQNSIDCQEAFVYFSYMYPESYVDTFVEKIHRGDTTRVMYNDPYYWYVLKNTSKGKKTPFEPKKRIDLTNLNQSAADAYASASASANYDSHNEIENYIQILRDQITTLKNKLTLQQYNSELVTVCCNTPLTVDDFSNDYHNHDDDVDSVKLRIQDPDTLEHLEELEEELEQEKEKKQENDLAYLPYDNKIYSGSWFY